jgi:RHS repeat-associated protein
LRQRQKRTWPARALAWTLVVAQPLLALPVEASPLAQSPKPPAPPAPPLVKVNRTVPKVEPPSSMPLFSAQPTAAEIFRARVFEEPLVPMAATADSENVDLAKALTTYLRQSQPEQTSPIETFLAANPSSPWRATLLTNLGNVYQRSGYYSRALAAWEEAWALAKGETDPKRKATADRALGDYAILAARLGRFEILDPLFEEIKGREVGGSAGEKLASAREGLWQMHNVPAEAFRCGPYALDRINAELKPGQPLDPRLKAYPSSVKGTSLLQMRDLARTVGIPINQMAKRSPGSALMAPALVHWKAGHFAALLRQDGDRFLVQDPTFGSHFWMSSAALDDETSGFFLVRYGSLPKGWTAVTEDQAGRIWGRGMASGQNLGAQTTSDRHNNKCSSGGGMAIPSVHLMLVNLTINDRPIGYQPARGPGIEFHVTYNQREVFQPMVFSYSNLGPKWTFDWLSYLEDNPASPSQDINLYARGGGQQTHSGYSSTTQSFAPQFASRAILSRTSTSPIRYERLLPDGSKEIFAQPDGASTFPRKIFLTQTIDAQGNSLTFTFDGSLRIVSVTDAVGQVTTVSYELAADPLKITKVTDPFGRFARFEYDPSGRLLRITDMIGIVSAFTYTTADFIDTLTTPYGTTQFETAQQGGYRSIQITDPIGGQERVEYWSIAVDANIPPTAEPAAIVPAGFSAGNGNLRYRNTFYWNRRAMALYPRDFSKAQIIHWLHSADVSLADGTVESEKQPLENRVWYAYPNQLSYPWVVGSTNTPSKIARVLDDGSTQLYQYDYGPRGNVCKKTDPLGRETRYTYGTNNVPDADCTTGTGVDLLKVEQKNGGIYDLLQTFTYNTLHQPLTVTDAAGQTTTSTYLADGRLQTVLSAARLGPNGQPLTAAERTTTYAYYPANAPTGANMLQSVTGPSTPQGSAVTSYTYDGYGRLRTTTDSDNYTLTFDYDGFDRPTRTTYPDGTYQETVYDRFDPVKRRDRLGRWSETFYDANQRVVGTRDPLGRTTTQQWCGCGSLDKVIDGNGNVTTWEHDLQGRVTKETRPNGSFKTLAYENTTSRLKSIMDPKNQTIQYGYDLDDKQVSITYQNAVLPTPNVTLSYRLGGQPTTGTADPHGRLTQVTDGTGTTSYAYYPVTGALGSGQLASVDGPLSNDTVSYGYDELGRVVSRSLNGVSTTWLYDLQGRPQTLTDPIGSFGYTYEGVTGRVATVTYPNGQASTYTYFTNAGDHRLQEILHKKPGGITLSKFDYTYDAVGNIKTWTQQTDANPAKVYSLAYDSADQLLAATLSGGATKRYRYAYDPAGNRTAEQIDDVVTGATYDNMNRLMSQQPGGIISFQGTVNEPATVAVAGKPATVTASNAFSASTPVSSGTSTVAVAATDPSGNTRTNTYQLSETGTTKAFTYDANGNLTGDGTKTYEWDANNMLLDVKQGGSTLASFTYDGSGRRSSKIAGGVTTTYIYDGANFLEERPSAGSTKRYVYGPGIDQVLAQVVSGTASYNAADHLGSIVRTTDSAGTPTLTRDYDPWGNLLQGSSTGGYAFTGREWEAESSLYYYRARYYDPKVGRFLSEDPVGLDAGPNFYSYVSNSPIDRTDALGLKVDENLFIKGFDVDPVSKVDAWEVAENLPRDYGKGYYVGGHGVPTNAATHVRDETKALLTPEQLARRLAGKKCIVLLACSAGVRGDESYAKKLATVLQTTVFAPDGVIQWMKAVGPKGTQYAGTTYFIRFQGNSKMRRFEP